MTIFGRDSLITSLQALPFTPGLAGHALRILAVRQGTRSTTFATRTPGKISTSIASAKLTAFEERPHSPYYGARRCHATVRGPAG